MGLGEKVLATLSRWWEIVKDAIITGIFPLWALFQSKKKEDTADILTQGLIEAFSPLAPYGFPLEEVYKQTKIMKNLRGEARLIFGATILLSAFASWMTTFGTVFSEKARRSLNQIHTPRIVPAETAFEAMVRGAISPQTAQIYAAMSGYSGEQFSVLDAASRNFPAPEETRNAFLRGLITDDTANRWLIGQGFRPETIPILKQLYFYIPPPPDLIRMAVREAFTPEIARRFGQYEDFPADFDKYAKQQGISSEWATRYWAAHWDLPGVSQGFEMLHRGIIDEADLKLLMRALDVMPFWRDRLLKISYRPYTRVDVRRMYNVGVFNPAEVKRAYLDLGYDSAKAEKMTQFTMLWQSSAERDLTKADIVDGFSRGLIPEPEAADLLESLGYSDAEAAFYLNRAKLAKASAKKKSAITAVKRKFERGLINQAEATRLLAAANLSQAEIDEAINSFIAAKEEEVFAPSVSDLRALLKATIISDSEFTSEMIARGASDKHITWYIRLTKKGVA